MKTDIHNNLHAPLFEMEVDKTVRTMYNIMNENHNYLQEHNTPNYTQSLRMTLHVLMLCAPMEMSVSITSSAMPPSSHPSIWAKSSWCSVIVWWVIGWRHYKGTEGGGGLELLCRIFPICLVNSLNNGKVCGLILSITCISWEHMHEHKYNIYHLSMWGWIPWELWWVWPQQERVWSWRGHGWIPWSVWQ